MDSAFDDLRGAGQMIPMLDEMGHIIQRHEAAGNESQALGQAVKLGFDPA
ncbi:hypothetical protein JCM17846_03330 [Iodidimonas nitroreducens]|uniref:Uncharacterized protein n=1 Tax=Iodidimonas nitroreducens TaxID=1236968 RepID=A0A5A7N2Y8_9PROT|nr:hypothetical protein JCM17846_03330 [Iodidimonas nitroreducens]